MYLADYHTHSATSPDGQLTVSELAEAAVRAGLDEICVTDHVDTVLWGDHRPREHFDWSRLLRELPEARETYTGRLAIRLGAELGEAPMGFDRAEKLLGEAPSFPARTWTLLSAPCIWRAKNSNILTCITLKKTAKRIIIGS